MFPHTTAKPGLFQRSEGWRYNNKCKHGIWVKWLLSLKVRDN